MKEKEMYAAPESEALEIKSEGVICASGDGEGTSWAGDY